MSTQWLLAKYCGDLRRREPRNIGVVLIDDGLASARFLAEQPTGAVDGRQLRFVNSAVAYRRWLRHWRNRMAHGDVLRELDNAADQNFYLEYGGELRLGRDSIDAAGLLDDLYTSLVDDTPDPGAEDVARLSERVIAPIEARLPKPIQRNSVVQVSSQGVPDELTFSYRYNNGVPHLMQRVSLTFSDARSWERVHAAAWNFQQVHSSDDANLKGAQLIALIKPREHDSTLEKQMQHLERNALVVDVSEPEAAQRALYDLLAE